MKNTFHLAKAWCREFLTVEVAVVGVRTVTLFQKTDDNHGYIEEVVTKEHCSFLCLKVSIIYDIVMVG